MHTSMWQGRESSELRHQLGVTGEIWEWAAGFWCPGLKAPQLLGAPGTTLLACLQTKDNLQNSDCISR